MKTRTVFLTAAAGTALAVGGVALQAQAGGHVSGEQRNTMLAFGSSTASTSPAGADLAYQR